MNMQLSPAELEQLKAEDSEQHDNVMRGIGFISQVGRSVATGRLGHVDVSYLPGSGHWKVGTIHVFFKV